MLESHIPARYFVPLSNRANPGQLIEVSAEDHTWASQHAWVLAGTYPRAKFKGRMLALHRLVVDAPVGLEVDHIDGNKLNARRDNLRICTRQENARNRKHQVGFKGVHFRALHLERGWKPWRASIQHQGEELHLGFFETEAEAAMAYNVAAIKYFGEFARLNIV